ncbi:MAG: hypothetical protein ACJA2S_002680 [Cyclobacteriaceae bacterium]|jgi:hypothetical protein
MKKISLNILYLMLSLLLLAFAMEQLFTFGHYNFTPRSPVDWVMKLDGSATYDYVILGSSRSLNNLDPFQIEQLTGKRGINLGVSSGQPFDTKLFAQQLIKKRITKSIYIQVDDGWNNWDLGHKSISGWLPYMKEENIWAEFEELENKEYYYLKNIPFYKYAKFDSEIGVRDFLKGLTGQQLSSIKTFGHVPYHEVLKKENRSLEYDVSLLDKANPHITEIIDLCKNNDIDVIFFTAPIFNANQDHSLLHKYLPNYFDFTNLIKNPDLFADLRHLNADGVAYFGEHICHIFEK